MLKETPTRNFSNHIQAAFLDEVRKRLPLNISFADELAEILSISRDSAYRRLRGETVLSLDEAKKLYDQFGVSLDAVLSSSSNMALFHHRAVNMEYNLERWLNSVIKNLDYLLTFTPKEMIYAAKDIPIFHYFRFPELASFKLFFWLKTLIRDPEFLQKPYTRNAVPEQLLVAASRTWKLYANVPSTEIWSDEAINDTLKQIAYYKECSFFSDPQDADRLLDQLIELTTLVRDEAADGKRRDAVPFRLFENELMIGDNTVFARMGSTRVVYINYNSLNLLTTLQDSFCEKTEIYLANMIRNSTQISLTAERARSKFFNKMTDNIEAFKKKIA